MSEPTKGASGPRYGTAYAVTFALMIIGNGPVLLLVAFYLRHVTMSPSTWRGYLAASLVVGAAIPLLLVGAVTVVALVRRDPDRSARRMMCFGLFWSAPVLIANHNAISDLRHGPTAIAERVRSAARFDEDSGGGEGAHVWHACKLTFADGSTHTLDRYAVRYSYEDPCHGIQAGDQIRLVKLPHVDEVIAIDALGSGGP